jgi:hypothetical protein
MLNQFPQSALNLLQTPEDPNARPSFPGKKKEITVRFLFFRSYDEWCINSLPILVYKKKKK